MPSTALAGDPALIDIAAEFLSLGGQPWLFERSGATSYLIDRPALSLRFDARSCAVEPHTANGRALASKLALAFLIERGRICFSPPQGDDLDQRLIAPGPYDLLRALIAGGAPVVFGLLSFEHQRMFEALPPSAPDLTGVPDALFIVPDRWLSRSLDGSTVAHTLESSELDAFARSVVAAPVASDPPPAPAAIHAEPDLPDAAYAAIVQTCRGQIAAGEVYQIVPSRTFHAQCADPFAAFRRLRATDPSAAMFYMPAHDFTLFGASPETAVTVSAEGIVEIRPIAGTRPRGATPAEDDALAAELLSDEKEIAEHQMLVDLARNDVARVSRPGTRVVTEPLKLLKQARVQHLVSTVRGQLRPGLDALHALQACMNMGTVSGAPKLRAMELLSGLEASRRGPYGGAITALTPDGALDTALVIRSALVREGVAQVRAGAGVVWDSDPLTEADETRRKASAVLAAIGARP